MRWWHWALIGLYIAVATAAVAVAGRWGGTVAAIVATAVYLRFFRTV